jgi:hypothetical protein
MSPADSGGRDVERYSPADSRLSEETLERLKRSVPANTYAAYKRELERYRPWCAEQRRVDVPATSETFAEYANHLAEAGTSPPLRRAGHSDHQGRPQEVRVQRAAHAPV